ncbi:hypothetical protein FVEG_16147 [Fusarium verticillioides 7600]|uniref:C2H2-type domain-containing protein n=1 Tax=Gibberella moniliformis (strain M3125 / FGSC 7600) TaxID=334819 RepID=W7MSJ3_GIBM7|nr:hypothetical protein FVEG_16147 [Fusarium verticillioides 7600]EWG47517.1 hypothetical protein FVEG_16147 [Fusarium verticillioides 7600]
MTEPECCQHELKQPIRPRNDIKEAKRTTQWDHCPHHQPNAPLRKHAAPLPPKHDMEPHYWSTNDNEDEDDVGNLSSSELKLIQNDEKKESITVPENGLPPQKRFTTSHGQQMTHGQVFDECDISDEDLVVISRPTHRPRENLHLDCPFYVYDPEKCRQCQLASNLQNISDVIEHLFQSHSRPCYCINCYEAFDTQICRDDHVLTGKCQRRTPGPLFGLSESQKSMLLETDSHCTGEEAQWLFIWSIVFPDSQQPRFPYLGQNSR